MFSFIKKIQQKPESQRRAIAMWVAFLITLIIFIAWVFSFMARLDSTAKSGPRDVETVSPIDSLSEIMSSFGGLFEDVF